MLLLRSSCLFKMLLLQPYCLLHRLVLSCICGSCNNCLGCFTVFASFLSSTVSLIGGVTASMHLNRYVGSQLHDLELRCNCHLSLQLNKLLARNPEELRSLMAEDGKGTKQLAEQLPQVRRKLAAWSSPGRSSTS